MNVLNNLELKEREHKIWTGAADGWRRRDKLLLQCQSIMMQ